MLLQVFTWAQHLGNILGLCLTQELNSSIVSALQKAMGSDKARLKAFEFMLLGGFKHSMDWCKGKPAGNSGNHRSSREIKGFF